QEQGARERPDHRAAVHVRDLLHLQLRDPDGPAAVHGRIADPRLRARRRGLAEAKEEVRRVVNLWQSGESFEKAGGRRERGLLFLGAPGTGKTMLAKGIATGFNCPIVTIPGSGFAQTFMGMDVVIVRFLARKAKKLARK